MHDTIRRAAALLLALLATSLSTSRATTVAIGPVTTVEDDGVTDEDWERLLDALDVLESGNRDEKLAVLAPDEDGDTVFWTIDMPPQDDEGETHRVVDLLRRYVAAERDPWVLDRVVAALADEMIEELTPVFRDLLRHPAPSVRCRAMQFFADDDSDLDLEDVQTLLERMWRSEHTPWVRARLIDALYEQDSEVHVDACPALMWHDDPELAEAAMDCVGAYATPGSVAELYRRATTGEVALRKHAWTVLAGLRAEELLPLASVLQSTPTADAPRWLGPWLLRVLDAAAPERAIELARRSVSLDDEGLVDVSLCVLGHHPGPQASEALARRVREGTEVQRAAAISWLDTPILDSTATEVLIEALGAGRPPLVRVGAVWALGGVATPGASDVIAADRKRFRSLLDGLAENDPDPAVRTVAAQATEMMDMSLRLEPESRNSGMPPCPLPGAGPGFVLASQEGATSVRCHAGPGIELSPERARRLPVDLLVDVADRFDDGESIWLSLETADDEPCWVPADAVRRSRPDEREDRVPRTTDFDLSIELSQSDAFRELEERGFVEAFDFGVTLVGVHIRGRSGTEALDVLRFANAAGPEMLRRTLDALLGPTGSPEDD